MCPVWDLNPCALPIDYSSEESRAVFHSAQDIEMVEVAGVEPASETASRNELHRLVYEVDVATYLETVGGRCHRPCQQVPSLLLIPLVTPVHTAGISDRCDGRTA